MRTLYSILGANPSDSLSDLKKAYHRAARKFHPDKNLSEPSSSDHVSTDIVDPSSSAAFVELTKAWNILSDEARRREYDSWLREQALREETSILFDTVTIDEIMDSWTVIDGSDTEEEPTDNSQVSYALDCRCGGSYVFEKGDMDSYATDTLYVLCSNCSLVVKVTSWVWSSWRVYDIDQ